MVWNLTKPEVEFKPEHIKLNQKVILIKQPNYDKIKDVNGIIISIISSSFYVRFGLRDLRRFSSHINYSYAGNELDMSMIKIKPE